MTETANLVIAELLGGPDTMPDELRHPEVTTTEEVVKVSYYGGYEHFERDRRFGDAVYRWTGRTRVAE